MPANLLVAGMARSYTGKSSPATAQIFLVFLIRS